MKLILSAFIAMIGLAPFAFAQKSSPAATQATALPSGPGPSASGIEVKIISVKIEYLAIKKQNPDKTEQELLTNDILLVIRLQISNKGSKAVTYQTFNGTPDHNNSASLLGSDKKPIAMATFGEFHASASTQTATLKPGDSLGDVLAFAPPAKGIKPTSLFLPAKNHGDSGMWKMEVKMEDEEGK